MFIPPGLALYQTLSSRAGGEAMPTVCFLLQKTTQKITLTVQYLVTGWMVSLSQPLGPLSLVSALCNFSERVGSQSYTHVYFNLEVFNITSEKLLQTRDSGQCCCAGGLPNHTKLPISTYCCFNIFASCQCLYNDLDACFLSSFTRLDWALQSGNYFIRDSWFLICSFSFPLQLLRIYF